MDNESNIADLCYALGITASTSYSWDDRSVEFTITAPIHPGINSGMRAEEYLYAALYGIYTYQKNKIQTQIDITSKEPIVSSKQISRLAKLLKRPTTKAKDSSV